jgi:hypothetical protein
MEEYKCVREGIIFHHKKTISAKGFVISDKINHCNYNFCESRLSIEGAGVGVGMWAWVCVDEC